VTLRASGTTLTIVSVSPNPGWTVVSQQAGPGEAKVTFKNGAQQVEFEAKLQGGVITTQVSSGEEEHA
jgi:hypothetical protein